MNIGIRASSVILLALCSACASPVVYVRGLRPLNLNDAGESTPVNVRFYQLADNRKFQEAAFEDLWVKDEEVLGEDRLAPPKVVTVLPGGPEDEEQKVVLEDFQTSARYVGILALFSRSEGGRRRRLVLTEGEADGAVVEIQGFGVALAEESREGRLDGTVPVEVRVYQLKDDRAFLEASFENLWTSEATVLKEDLTAEPVAETVHPGKPDEPTPLIKIGPFRPRTLYVGVVSLYVHEGQEQKRRRVVRLTERSQYLVDLGGNAVLVEGGRD